MELDFIADQFTRKHLAAWLARYSDDEQAELAARSIAAYLAHDPEAIERGLDWSAMRDRGERLIAA